jgi:hypothetical protein
MTKEPFARLRRSAIDVHVHVFKTDPTFQKMLERLNLKLMNILVMDDTNSNRKQLQAQIDDAWALVQSSRGHIALCTTFDPYKFGSASFSADAINQLEPHCAHAHKTSPCKNKSAW